MPSKLVGAVVTILSAAVGVRAIACPYCKVAGGDLGNELAAAADAAMNDSSSQPASDQAKNASPVRIGLAADVTNAYFRHGYLQQDRGVIFQPTLSFSLQPIEHGGWSIDPYFVWFNSIHSRESPGYAGGHGNHTRVEQQYQQYLAEPHAGTPFPHYHTRLVDVIAFDDAGGGWFETELKPGIVFTRGPLIVDVNVMGSIYPTNFHDTMIELGVRVSYDLASLWDDQSKRPFSLRLNNAVAIELRDDNGEEETVIETTLEPAWRFKFGDYPALVSVPIGTGWSLDGFYQDVNTDDATFGYVSLGVKATVELPVDRNRGRWFINAGVTWYHFLADSTIFANGGDDDGVTASVGFGVAF